MINAFRRGEMAGNEAGHVFPVTSASEDVVRSLARCVHTLLKEEHERIEPRDEFISGFVSSFRIVSMQPSSRN